VLTADEKIAVSRATIEALNARDFDRYLAYTAPDFVVCTDSRAPGGQVTVGLAGIERFVEHIQEDGTEFAYEFIEGPVAEGDRVFSHDRWTVGTGDEARSMEFFSVCTYRDGLVARVDMFADRKTALEFARSGRDGA
jgi:hypothetical protein